MEKLCITHIINPVKVGPTSDLYKAQPITFETMRIARDMVSDHLDVNLVSVQFEEDRAIIPDYFHCTENLERSVLDVGSFNHKRKLPLIDDLLERGLSYDPDVDYVIYTNADIALMPYFYQFVERRINEGLDGFVINRRTIAAHYELESLTDAYSDAGKKHPGFDCFVIRSSLIERFLLQEICIGTTRIGLALIANLIMHASNFKVFNDEHLSFHLGEDRVWQNPKFDDYVAHNEKHAREILSALRQMDQEKFDNSELLKKYYNNLFEKEVAKKSSFIERIKRRL